jgi:hypothetical protein
MDIKANIAELHDKLVTKGVTLVAVSKTKPEEDIMIAYEAGHRDFGENKVQELTAKAETLPKDIRWHMIGHLQRNKVKYIADFIHLIHSVDSLRLLRAINKEGRKAERIISCLLQVHIAEEESKYGFDAGEIDEAINLLPELEFVRVRGLMGMATFTDNNDQVRREFAFLHQMFEDLSRRNLPQNMKMEILSTGMSGDYNIAIEEGSTMVRIGSAIFGARN